MKLRPYQAEAKDRVFDHLANNKSTLVSMATGLGKSVIVAHVANEVSNRVLVMAHRDELIRQLAEKLEIVTGEKPGIEMGNERIEGSMYGGPRVVVTSVQTMSREKRLEKFDPKNFDLVVTDEAHHAVGASYRKVIDHYLQNDACRHLGVTATPNRADGLALGQVFQSVAYSYQIEEAITDGWLVPIHQRVVQVDGLDFSQVHTLAGDFNEGELENVLNQEKVLHGVAAPLIEIAGDLPSLVFCVTVNHARQMAEVLNRYKRGCAAWLCGDRTIHPPELRREIVSNYKSGRLQVLCSVGIFLEGFDAPHTAVIAWARPTKSLPLYVQGLGRGTRPLGGIVDGLDTAEERTDAIASSPKPYVLCLDFAGNAGRHKIVRCVDVLGGKYGEAIRDYAKKTEEEEAGGEGDVLKALERARLEWELEQEEARRKQHLRAVADYQQQKVDIFDATNYLPPVTGVGISKVTASEKQIRYLVRLGISEAKAKTFSQRQASVVIDKLVKRERQRAG